MAAPPSSMRPPPPTDDTGLPPSSSTSSTATAPPRGGGTTHPPTDPLSSPAIQLYKNTTDQGIRERESSQNAQKTHGSAMTDQRQKTEGSFGSFDSLARGCESFYRAGPGFPPTLTCARDQANTCEHQTRNTCCMRRKYKRTCA